MGRGGGKGGGEGVGEDVASKKKKWAFKIL
jgi:hypothetical protein